MNDGGTPPENTAADADGDPPPNPPAEEEATTQEGKAIQQLGNLTYSKNLKRLPRSGTAAKRTLARSKPS
eukprot:scaffold10626_cov112-Cylindrotheca_fusiformis.AAC.15